MQQQVQVMIHEAVRLFSLLSAVYADLAPNVDGAEPLPCPDIVVNPADDK